MALMFCFYLFSALAITSAMMVVFARNPVHAVLFLILVFVNAAGLFLLLGAEFLSVIFVIVYVGAVAVLFLFVVMMLDCDFTSLKRGFLNYLPIGALVGGVLFFQILAAVGAYTLGPSSVMPASPSITNTEALGKVIYTDYILLFQMAGGILLIAMIGAIILTVRHNPKVKRQDPARQVQRDVSGVELRKVPFGQGISER